MAVTLVTSAQGSDYGGTGYTSMGCAAFNLAAGNLVVLATRWFNQSTPTSVSSVTDTAGNTYAKAENTPFETTGLDLWYAYNSASNASNVVTANYSTSIQYPGILVLQYSGLITTDPLDTIANGADSLGNTSVSCGNFTTTQADELLLAFGQVDFAGGTWTADTGWTLEAQDASNVLMAQDKIVSSIQTTVQTTITSTATQAKAIVVATFKAATGGGGGNPWYLYAQQRRQ